MVGRDGSRGVAFVEAFGGVVSYVVCGTFPKMKWMDGWTERDWAVSGAPVLV